MKYLVALVSVLTLLSTWGLGGRYAGVEPALGVLSLSSLVPGLAVWLERWRGDGWNAPPDRERRRLLRDALRLSPWILLVVWLGISVANPAFTRAGVSIFSGFFAREHITWLPSTVEPEHTFTKALFLIGCMVLSVVLVRLLETRRQIRWMLAVIAANGVLLAVTGGIFHFWQAERILGIVDPRGAAFYATFYYRNHWAAFAMLALCCVLALGESLQRSAELRSRRATLFLLAVGGFFLAASIPLSGSRSGTLLLFGIIIILLARLLLRRESEYSQPWWRRSGFYWLLSLVFVVLGSIYFGAEKMHQRWQDTKIQLFALLDDNPHTPPEFRYYLNRDTLRMALAKPWMGWGLGSYVFVYPAFAGQDTYNDKGKPRLVEFAHQDWLQYWAELGAIGFFLLLSVPIGVFFHGIRHGKANGVSFWLLTGVGLMGLQACLDFPLSNPAVLLHTFLLGAFAYRYAILQRKNRWIEKDGPHRLRP